MCLLQHTDDNNWNLVVASFPESDEFFDELMTTTEDVSNSQIKPEDTRTESMVKEKMDKPEQAQESNPDKRKRLTALSSSKKSLRTAKEEPPKKKSKTGNKSAERPALTTKGFKRHFAKHDYHDYARFKPSQIDIVNMKASRGGVHSPFPTILHGMMEEIEEQEGFSDIISWQSHGRAFLIRDPKMFAAKVLPKFFKHAKLSSFQRQLSLYGFVRLTQDGPDRGAYYHECFLRGRPFLCFKITRTRVKGTWVRTSSSPESEPDFNTMETVVDLNKIEEDSHSDGGSSRSEEETGLREVESDIESGNGSLRHDADFVVFKERSPPSQLMDTNSSFRQKKRREVSHFIVNDETPPLTDAGLLPPPGFPTHIISTRTPATNKRLPKQLITASTRSMMPSLKEVLWPTTSGSSSRLSLYPSPALLEFVPSFAGSRTRFAPLDDDELAQFLTDVDLDTDFDNADVIQITTV